MGSGDRAPVILVTGQQDCTRERFDRYYAPAIKSGMKKGWNFVMGAADGVDEMAAELLAGDSYTSVTIYDKGDNVPNRGIDGWALRSGFASYTARDEEMCRDASHIIVYLFDEAAPTGTFFTLMAFADLHTTTSLTPEVVRDLARACQRDTVHSSKTWIVDKQFGGDFANLKRLFVAAEENCDAGDIANLKQITAEAGENSS